MCRFSLFISCTVLSLLLAKSLVLWDVHAASTYIITLCPVYQSDSHLSILTAVAMWCTVGTLNIQTDIRVCVCV